MKKTMRRSILAVITAMSVSTNVSAYIDVNAVKNGKATNSDLLKTAAGCNQSTAAIDLDINNVKARLMTGGDMWYNTGTNQPGYEVPKGSGKHSLYAGACWIGGIDANNQLKVAAQTYRSQGNDNWPGPIDKVTNDITAASCAEWDRFWKVDASLVQEFVRAFEAGGADAIVDEKYNVIKQWPATGNISAVGAHNNPLPELLGAVDEYGYAPFVDVDGDGIYDWKNGDYPRAYGVEGSNPSQFIWWVFNDKGNVKNMSNSQAIGMEVQTFAFAYTSTDFLNDATFFNYRLINRGALTLDSCFIATFTDADLGNPYDDYIGCDTARGLGILYNMETPDRVNGANSYGTRLPMIGVDFFIGPRKDYIDPVTGRDTFRLLKMSSFSYYNGVATGPLREPRNAAAFYNYMTGTNADGIPFSNDQARCPGSVGYGLGPVAPFVFYGDPGSPSEWSMCACKTAEADRRFIHSSGPFTLKPGAKNDITIGIVWVDDVGACGTGSFKKIRAADDVAQALFDQGFKRVEGPEAPLLTIREMNNKLIFYISNPEESNNFGERYGDPEYISDARYRVTSSKAKGNNSPDSLYRFEGYRVFQLRHENVSLFDENGNLSEDAIEVFQTDRKNGIKQIANYKRNLDVTSPINQYDLSIKVNGKDSGIVHSFVLTEDAFATGTNKSLVNYKTYYYQAIAYAHNNFADFDPANEPSTQDVAYLIGDNGPGRKAIARYAAMPHSMNQMGDTFSNAQYGDGVIITRIEGLGNGGIDVQIDDTTEQAIFLAGSNDVVAHPTYKSGKGPVDIKVADPVKLVNSDWRISIYGNAYLPKIAPSANDTISTKILLSDSTMWKLEKLANDGTVEDVIYSERNIKVANEQLLSKYGLSVAVAQVSYPGVDQQGDNGYITSDVSFEDVTKPWLTGVKDEDGISFKNWVRSGGFDDVSDPVEDCGPFDDYKSDSTAKYNNMFANNTFVSRTWAPYDLASYIDGTTCGFSPGYSSLAVDQSSFYRPGMHNTTTFSEYPNVDLVFTSDRSKWTKCVVLEAQSTAALAEGNAPRMKPRSHASWNGDLDEKGSPIYSTTPGDTGFSYFPGYAINQLTGERLNIVFSEDSYLKKLNGADMIWNPTSDDMSMFNEVLFGGKHFTYILNTKYDTCKSFVRGISQNSQFINIPAYRQMRWVGIPLLNSGYNLLPLKDGLIPTETRLRFRVNTPYQKYKLMDNQVAINNQNPVYKFTTKGMAPVDFTKKSDVDAMLDRIFVVPNPYKGQASGGGSYEMNRMETKVKIINLPVKATVNIYSLDGTLVRRLQKDNNETFIAWDLYNLAGLPVASGMYLIHVNAYGKDKVLRWFGAMRPLDVTNY
jgi:hypothetical protein